MFSGEAGAVSSWATAIAAPRSERGGDQLPL
jgi:hypothetical protein